MTTVLASELYPKRILSEKNPMKRNQLAMDYLEGNKDTNHCNMCNALLSLVKTGSKGSNTGTLVYVLTELNCAIPIDLLSKVLATFSYESSFEARFNLTMQIEQQKISKKDAKKLRKSLIDSIGKIRNDNILNIAEVLRDLNEFLYK